MSVPPKYVVDGSNVCNWPTGKPSIGPLLTCLLALKRRGDSFFCYFDANILHFLRDHADAGERQCLESLLQAGGEAFLKVTGGIQADRFLLPDADRSRAKVISNDKFDQYKTHYAWITDRSSQRLIKGSVVRGVLTIPDLDLHEPVLPVQSVCSDLLEALRQSSHLSPTLMSHMLPAETAATQSLEARLIVFALDASGSMHNVPEGATATFDGRRKSEHLSEVLKGTVSRLSESSARDSFYLSLVNFAGTANLVPISGSTIAHVTRVARLVEDSRFSYLTGSSGAGTNLSMALRTAVKVIDDALNEPKNQELASVWHALIVLITDGKDTVDERAVYAEAAKIATQRSGLVQKTIRLAVVAIGDDCQIKLLSDIAAEADDGTVQRLGMSGLLKHVVTPEGSRRPRLLIRVDATDSTYCDAIRSFIDIVSHTG